jgi:CheY-like chemotaxis protein
MNKCKVLLIDDVRVPENIKNPDDSFDYYDPSLVEIVRTAEEGIEILKQKRHEVLLLDHDMGPGLTGMAVIRFLEENQDLMPQKIYLVTANVVMGPLMVEYLQRWFKEGKILAYKWMY